MLPLLLPRFFFFLSPLLSFHLLIFRDATGRCLPVAGLPRPCTLPAWPRAWRRGGRALMSAPRKVAKVAVLPVQHVPRAVRGAWAGHCSAATSGWLIRRAAGASQPSQAFAESSRGGGDGTASTSGSTQYSTLRRSAVHCQHGGGLSLHRDCQQRHAASAGETLDTEPGRRAARGLARLVTPPPRNRPTFWGRKGGFRVGSFRTKNPYDAPLSGKTG